MTEPFANRSHCIVDDHDPDVSWDGFWEEYLDWANGSVLRAQTPESMVHKFREESEEFLKNPTMDEAIDCMAVLMFWLDHTGVPFEHTACRAYERLDAWKQRTWARLPNGAYRHTEPCEAVHRIWVQECDLCNPDGAVLVASVPSSTTDGGQDG